VERGVGATAGAPALACRNREVRLVSCFSSLLSRLWESVRPAKTPVQARQPGRVSPYREPLVIDEVVSCRVFGMVGVSNVANATKEFKR
jgi:hypothetical protein